ncbi:uncharacterized protein LOC113273140 [Papaver somniferum]|uniref:uncharacterized protein LOC113273140 n=1 Tax=Papaver somniferum TaxID=3469 RepID=UPI000E6FA450|nr:uncharacterized protein LOC113273140 [Papaver somniferum]
MNLIWNGDWEVESQELKLRKWEPNFNPESQRTSMAYVWVQLPGLSIQYWKDKILMNIGKALGRPIKFDETTFKKEAGYYANILVEMDLAKEIPSKINVTSKYGTFDQLINIPNMPKFCYNSKIVGHHTTECRSKKTSEVVKQPKQVWRVVTSKKTNTQVPFDICNPVIPMEQSSLSEEPSTPNLVELTMAVPQNSAAGAPAINKISTIIPHIGRKVANENVPKVKQKT